MKCALVGPPNVGKSTIFYRLVGRRVKIANYPGKTLSKAFGYFIEENTRIEISDLPGIFNIENPKDEDEKLAISDVINGDYDCVIVVGAPHAIKESLSILRYLAKIKRTIFVLNMVDLASPVIDENALSTKLGVPVIFTSAAKGTGIYKLRKIIKLNAAKIGEVPEINVEFKGSLWMEKLFTKSSIAIPTLIGILLGTLMIILFFIDGNTPFGNSPVALIPIIESFLDYIGNFLTIPNNPILTLFIVNGIWSGVSTVMTFIPYIAAVAFFMSLYEQTGLIGAFSIGIEKITTKLGIPPRSIIIFFMGASCNVPSLSAARALWGMKSRYLTALLVPYVPCAPRMALFLIIASAVLPPILVPLAVLLPYLASIIAIFFSFFIYRLIMGKPMAVERLPPTPIMLPNWRIIIIETWNYIKEFLKKLSLMIFATTILLWLPSVLGPHGITFNIENSWLAIAGKEIEFIFAPLGLPWQVSVMLMGGWIFKEVVLGLMALFGGFTLIKSLSIASALALMVFIAFYSSCIATLLSLAKIIGWHRALLSLIVQLVTAYIFSYITYSLISILG
ncbi:FeoB small GTPase domain-containing protein [Caldisphaera sp.]|uniref:FeoB small GTPase domain-containing protein n=1 Tax=Caldisphaera sp. TaxID=2060322 RepID=UPI003D0B265A